MVLREGIFMASYRAVIQSVCKSPSRQKSGLVVNQRECGVKSASEERLLCLFENNHILWLNVLVGRWSSYTQFLHTSLFCFTGFESFKLVRHTDCESPLQRIVVVVVIDCS